MNRLAIHNGIVRIFVLAILASAPFSFLNAQNSPHSLNVSGGLFTSTGAAVVQAGVNFKIEILDKNATCVLYSEQHMSEDLTNSKGAFSLLVGEGTSISNKLEGTAAFTAKIFENNGATGAFTGCASGVTNASGDERLIRIYYDLGAGFIAMTPDVPIVSAPFALVAETLQGKNASDFAQINTGSAALSQANLENIFSNVNYPKLNALVNGSSTQYMVSSPSSAVGFNGQRITSVGTPTAATDAANKSYVDGNVGGKTVDVTGVGAGVGGGKTLVWDQALNKWVAQTPSAALSQIVAGTGLVSNTITTTGTLAVDVGTTANKIVQLNAQGKLPALDAFLLTNIAFPVTSVAGRTGAVTLNPADISGLGTAATQNYGTAANNLVQLNGSAQLPAVDGSLLTNVNATKLQSRSIAATAPVAGQVLTWNATTSVWEPRNAAVSGITDLTGDVSASGSGSVAATIANSAITSAKINASGYAINRILITDSVNPNLVTYANCSNGDVLRYGPTGWLCNSSVGGLSLLVSGTGLVAGSITTAGTLNVDVGTTAGKVLQVTAGGQYPALDGSLVSNINAVKIQSRNIASTAPAGGQVLGWNSSSAQWEPTSTSGVGTVTGVYAGTGLVGNTITASGTLSVDVGTTANKIVQLTSSAQYPGADGALIANINAVKLQSRGIAATAPIANQVLTWNTTTSQWEPQAAQAGASAFVQNGNAFGTTANLGTTDVTNLNLITNNSAKMTITAGGNIGIGTTAPTSALHVIGSGTFSSGLAVAGTVTTTNVTANSYMWSPSYYGSIAANGNLVLDSTINASKGVITIAPSGGNVGIGTTTPNAALDINGTGTFSAVIIPRDTTANRNAAPVNGMIRYNTNTSKFEAYEAGSWSNVIGTASNAFVQNGNAFGTTATLGTTDFTNLNLITNNSAKLTITSGGNVGVGTTSPTYPLEVVTNQGAIAGIKVTNSSSSPGAADFTLASDTATLFMRAYSSGSGGSTQIQSSGNLILKTVSVSGAITFHNLSGTPQMQLNTPTGAVGIGTTTPAGILDLNGTGTFSSLIVPRDTTANRSAAPVNGMLRYNTNTSKFEAYEAGSWANVIGTASNAFVQNGNAFGTTATLGTTDITNLNLISNNSTRLTITSGGSVGIGTTAPAYTFDVNGLSRSLGSYTKNGNVAVYSASSSSQTYPLGVMTSVQNINSGDNTGSVLTLLSANTSGVSQSAYIGSFSTSGVGVYTPAIMIGQQTGPNSYTERLRVDSSGNFGIGTTAPGAALDVNGTGTFSSLILPRDTTANRSGTPVNGMLRYNTNTSKFEAYEAGSWSNVIGSASNAFVQNGNAYGTTATLGTTDFTNLNLITNNSTRLTITPSGNIGIGTTSPASPLEVDNTSSATSGAINSITMNQIVNGGAVSTLLSRGGYFTSNYSATSTSPSASTVAVEGYAANSWTGTVGAAVGVIGTAQNANSGAVTSGYGGKFATTVSSGTMTNAYGVYTGAIQGTNRWSFYASDAGSNNYFAGNVGIGSATPNVALDVNGTGTFSGLIVPRATTALRPAATNGTIRYNTNTSKFEAFESGAWTNMIGSSANAFVNGGNAFGSAASLGTTDVTNLNILTCNNVQMTVTSQGYVGIGTKTPAGILDVNAGTAAPANDGTDISLIAQSAGLGNQNGGTTYLAAGNATGSGVGGDLMLQAGANPSQSTTPSYQGLIWAFSSLVVNNLGPPGGVPTDLTYRPIEVVGQIGSSYVSSSTTTSSPVTKVALPQASIRVSSLPTANGGAYLELMPVNSSNNNQIAYLGAYSTQGASKFTPTIVLGRQTGSTTYNEVMRIDTSGNVGIGTTSPGAALDVNGTSTFSSIIVPRDTTANRSGTPVNGMLRYNTNTSKFEAYEAGSWSNVIGSASNAFVQNGNAFGTTAQLGTTDVTNLNLLTCNNVQMTVTANGNVGIGTTAPGNNLQVVRSSSTIYTGTGYSSAISAQNTDTTDGNAVGFAFQTVDTGASTVAGSAVVGTFENHTAGAVNSSLAFLTKYSGAMNERLRISNAGNVGIGTNTPSVALDVNGTGTFSGLVVPRATTALRPASVNGTLRYNTNTSKFEFYEGGVWVNHNSSANGFLNGGNAFGSNASLGTTDITNLSLLTCNNTQMTITSQGNVGIGTAAPSTKFEVSGDLTSQNGTFVKANADTFLGVINSSSTTARFPTVYVANYDSTGFGGSASFTLIGSRGTRASPTATQSGDQLGILQMYGGLASGTAAGTSGSSIAAVATQNFTASANGSDLRLSTNPNGTVVSLERMRIDQAGQIGIGTTTPAAILDVNGTGTFSGIVVPRSTTALRPASVNGMLRYNTNTSKFEAYEGGAWVNLSASGSGGFVNGGNAFGATASLGTTDVTNLNFLTCNNTQMTITSRGSVGIGTTTPSSPLHVTGAIRSDSSFIITNGAQMVPVSSGLQVNLSAGGDFAVANSLVSPMVTVKQSGSMGIGTTTPGAALDVNGTGTYSALIVPRDTTANRPTALVNGMIRYNINTAKLEAYENGAWGTLSASRANSFVNGGNAFGSVANLGTTDVTNLNLLTCNNVQLTVTAQGNVGIGTTIPVQKLDILGNLRFSAAYPTIEFNGAASSLGLPAANTFAFTTSGFERLRVDNIGNVGIGTASPNARLEVQSKILVSNATNGSATNVVDAVSDSTYGPYLHLRKDGTNEWFLQADPSSTSTLNFRAGNITNSPAMAITTAGNVGIGTNNPNSTLQIAGSIATSYSAPTTNYSVSATDSVVYVTAGSAATVTLPSAVGISGRQYTIKNGSTNTVTVATTSSQTVDGATTYSLSTQYQYVTVVSNGANWGVVGSGPAVITQKNTIYGTNSGGATLAASSFISLPGNSGANSTEAQAQLPVPAAGTFKNFCVNLTTSPFGTPTSFTVRKNASNTSLSITIPAFAAIGVYCDNSNSATFAAGDLVSLAVGSGAGIKITGWSVEFDPN